MLHSFSFWAHGTFPLLQTEVTIVQNEQSSSQEGSGEVVVRDGFANNIFRGKVQYFGQKEKSCMPFLAVITVMRAAFFALLL